MHRLATVARDRRTRGADGAPDGWATLKNGELLALAAENFDAFVTVDRNLTFQQRLTGFSIAVVVLCARTNRLIDLRPLVPELLAALPNAKAGVATPVGA